MQQRDGVHVEARFAGAGVTVVPRTELQSAGVVAGAEHEEVTFTELDTLGPLCLLQLGARDGGTWLQPRHPPQPRDVEENATAHDTLRILGDVEDRRAGRGHGGRRAPVVQLPAVGDVTERVDVGVAVAVELHADEVGGKTQAAGPDVVVVPGRHVMNGRVRVVRPGRLVHGQRQ